MDGSASAAPLLAFLVGVVLSLSPIALPSVPAVMTVVSPGVVGTDGIRRRFPVRHAVPVVGAFVIGMDGVIGAIGLAGGDRGAGPVAGNDRCGWCSPCVRWPDGRTRGSVACEAGQYVVDAGAVHP